MVLTAPLVSNPGLLRTLFKKIRSDEDAVREFLDPAWLDAQAAKSKEVTGYDILEVMRRVA